MVMCPLQVPALKAQKATTISKRKRVRMKTREPNKTPNLAKLKARKVSSKGNLAIRRLPKDNRLQSNLMSNLTKPSKPSKIMDPSLKEAKIKSPQSLLSRFPHR
jgi:hypothetical protein